MIRLHFLVEGVTEQLFVRDTLAPHLLNLGVSTDQARVQTSRNAKASRKSSGGNQYGHLRNDLMRRMKEDDRSDSWFTTMFDLYRLPKEFPGFAEAAKLSDSYARVALLEQRLSETFPYPRFIPYIQVHEFEALLLADASQLQHYFAGHAAAAAKLAKDGIGIQIARAHQ